VPRTNILKRRLGGPALRRLIPAIAVAAVMGFSYLAQVPSAASVRDVGYGYGNNCGVKGSGYHDHGKVCPNRPFPGKGVDKSAVSDNTVSKVSSEATAAATTANTSSDNTTTAVTEDSQSAVKSRGQGKGKGHGKGHGKGN
jgi:hypothetical protein